MFKNLVSFCALILFTILSFVAHTQTIAFDSAGTAAYSGGWSNGANGGNSESILPNIGQLPTWDQKHNVLWINRQKCYVYRWV